MGSVTAMIGVATRQRAYVRVAGRDAADYLQRMLSNDVLALAPGESCDALLLTAKARVIATVRVVRRAPDDFLLLTEPGLGDVVRDHLLRTRFAARCEVELEEHRSVVVLGGSEPKADAALCVPCPDYGVPAVELLDADIAPTLTDEELERLRIGAGTPVFGRDIDDRVLPAEARLTERAVSFSKGCYPGQEPVARLHYRGRAHRSLRVLRIETTELPEPNAEIVAGDRPVGWVTSAVRADGGVVALGYVRVEVEPDAELVVQGARATMTAPERP